LPKKLLNNLFNLPLQTVLQAILPQNLIMEPFGFDKLPEVVRQLFEKVEHMEALLFKLHHDREARKNSSRCKKPLII
jgi:hypothetical protein